MKEEEKTTKESTDNCYLEYVDGHLTCTFNHEAGEECLMSTPSQP